jgi:catechol 2,3-dioxygenase-like lactoylglutathione lyase family enzyme
MSIRFLVAIASLAAAPLFAQLASPESNRGVVMGHLHLIVRDVDAQRKFWIDLGGTPVKNGALDMIEFPGVYVLLRKGEPSGGTVGSVINHVGFYARNSAESAAKWRAAGLNPEAGRQPGQFYLTTADGVRIEIQEDKTISTPLKFSHVHFNFTPDITSEVQAWYARIFDARPGVGGRYKSGNIPGARLTYGESKEKMAPTKGRALDHIGFEVANMDLFAQKLEAQGIKFDVPPKTVNATTKVAFLTDPWGTSIELTQGLAPAKLTSASH